MGGFSAVLGNPPFLGGQKITGQYGDEFRKFILRNIANSVRGSADLCAYFLLHIERIMCLKNGFSGLVFTNTISEGDSREVGIAQIYPDKLNFFSVIKDHPWGGDASVVVSLISSSRVLQPKVFLNNEEVKAINTRLMSGIGISWHPLPLLRKKNSAFMGDNLYGSGFQISEEEYQMFRKLNPNVNEIIREYVNGKSLVTNFPIRNDGFVICAEDFSDTELRNKFPHIYRHLEQTVKVTRQKAKSKKDREIWWKFTAFRKEMRNQIGNLNQVFARPQSSSTHALILSDVSRIHSIKCILFPTNSWNWFNIYQSNIYERWIWEYSSSLSSTISYSISDCYATFPEINLVESDYAESYYQERENLLLKYNLGLTKLLNLVNSVEHNSDFDRLKFLHMGMDKQLAEQIGVDLTESDYGNFKTKFGNRWTILGEKWEEIHSKLLEMNRRQFEEDSV